MSVPHLAPSRPATYRACIGIGSNLNNPKRQIARAIETLAKLEGTQIDRVSNQYLTKAWGVEDQPDFINVVAGIDTHLKPEELLQCLQKIERDQDRIRTVKWGPRTVDLDIICYGDLTLLTNELQIPHKHCLDRAFVLVPLAEIYPNIHLRHQPVSYWLNQLDTSSVSQLY